MERDKGGTAYYSALWQADRNKIQRMAPADFMGRHMCDWFDYAIADEVHQLAGNTAQGNALGVLARVAKKVAGLTGTLLSGYADDLYNTLFRVDASRMVRDGFTWGSAGKERFTHEFGVMETIERTKIEDNACSRKNKTEVTIRRKPGASPLLFGKYLMDTCAFVSLEDISDALPAYREDVIPVAAGGRAENSIRATGRRDYRDVAGASRQSQRAEHHAQCAAGLSRPSLRLGHALRHPLQPGNPTARKLHHRRNRRIWMRARFIRKSELSYEEIQSQLARGRKCQVFAVYTNKHDVTARLEKLLRAEGIRAGVLRASVATHKREAWYREHLKRGIDVVICHPKLVETGLDLLEFPAILFHETGYSLHTLRQASRRSWRIGQKHPVEVKFFAYSGSMQEVCLRLMGKKLLVALAMEGKFTSDGLQAIDGDDDMLTAMARELVQNKGIGESADNLWRRVGAFLPTSGQHEPIKELPAVSEGNGARHPSVPNAAGRRPPNNSRVCLRGKPH